LIHKRPEADPFSPLVPAEQIPARALIKQFIVWWRTLEPADALQQATYARLPGTIRLIDTISNWWAEQRKRENPYKTNIYYSFALFVR
jgi:hypothetical protein